MSRCCTSAREPDQGQLGVSCATSRRVGDRGVAPTVILLLRGKGACGLCRRWGWWCWRVVAGRTSRLAAPPNVEPEGRYSPARTWPRNSFHSVALNVRVGLSDLLLSRTPMVLVERRATSTQLPLLQRDEVCHCGLPSWLGCFDIFSPLWARVTYGLVRAESVVWVATGP
jgi:hypothetical protein